MKFSAVVFSRGKFFGPSNRPGYKSTNSFLAAYLLALGTNFPEGQANGRSGPSRTTMLGGIYVTYLTVVDELLLQVFGLLQRLCVWKKKRIKHAKLAQGVDSYG